MSAEGNYTRADWWVFAAIELIYGLAVLVVSQSLMAALLTMCGTTISAVHAVGMTRRALSRAEGVQP